MIKTMKMNMKRLRLILATMLMTMSLFSFGQVFMLDFADERTGLSENEIELINPLHDVEYDQTNYAPLEGGVLLLASFGMVYLMMCKKRERQ